MSERLDGNDLMPQGPLSAQQPKLQGTLKGHKGGVFSVVFSPDGKTLVTGGFDIKLWGVPATKKAGK